MGQFGRSKQEIDLSAELWRQIGSKSRGRVGPGEGMVEMKEEMAAGTGEDVMYFQFGTRKIVEAVAVLLRSHQSRRMGRRRLLKLLYIADRESLRGIGRPIIGTELVAMDQGPLHGKVYDLIKGSHPGEEVWAQFLGNVSFDVRLLADPGVKHLSRYELKKLEETARKYSDVSDDKLARLTHGFKEWAKNHKRPGSSRPIPMEDILDAVGRASETGEIAEDVKRVAKFNSVFGVPS